MSTCSLWTALADAASTWDFRALDTFGFCFVYRARFRANLLRQTAAR